MKLTLPYPPSLNKMYRSVNGRVLISSEGRAYKQHVKALCLANRVKPLEGELGVEILAFRPQKRGDLDNIFKGLFDACNGHFWHDDSQIVRIEAERLDDKNNPRIEINVRSLKV